MRFKYKEAILFSFEAPEVIERHTVTYMDNLVVVLGVIGNILSVVGVVICNKYITEKDGYNFMVFLSALHFTATYLVIYLNINLPRLSIKLYLYGLQQFFITVSR